MTDGPFVDGYDSSVVVDGHVSWDLLTEEQQDDLLANFPKGTLDTTQFEAWLDTAYLQRTTVTSGTGDFLT